MTTARLRHLGILLLLATTACGGEPSPETVQADPLDAYGSQQGPDLPPYRGLLQGEHHRDLVVLSIDTLRADRLPFYGGERPLGGDPAKPWSLSWIAEHGTTFEQVWAPGGVTLPSLGTLWTGISPLEHGALGNREPIQVRGLGTRLKKAGWKGYGVTTNGILMEKTGLAEEFDGFQPRDHRYEKRIPKLLLPMAETAIQEGSPLFLWAHYMNPHQPYQPRQPFRGRWSQAEGVTATTDDLHGYFKDPSRLTEEAHAQLLALYDEEVLGTNSYARSFLHALDQAYRDAGRGPLEENIILVLVSDHGEGLGDRDGFFLHSKSLYSGVVQVPCVIFGGDWPAGERITQGLALEDLLPMVIDGTPPTAEIFFSSIRHGYFSARDARWTLIHNPAGDPHGPKGPPADVPFFYPEVALYDRHADPQERIDVAAEHPEVTRRLLDALHRWYSELEVPDVEAEQLSAEDLRILEQLGYAGGEEEPEHATQRGPWKGSDWHPTSR